MYFIYKKHLFPSCVSNSLYALTHAADACNIRRYGARYAVYTGVARTRIFFTLAESIGRCIVPGSTRECAAHFYRSINNFVHWTKLS